MSDLPPPPALPTSSRNVGGWSSSEARTSPHSRGAPPPHVTAAPIPALDSAPPSGNFDMAALPSSMLSSASLSLPPIPPPPSVTKGCAPAMSSFSTTPPLAHPQFQPSWQQQNMHPSRLDMFARPEDGGASTLNDVLSTEQVKNPTVQPPPLSISTFSSPQLQLLARRQTHIPILVIATEASNRLAWKNHLRLTDMFQGLVEDQLKQSDVASKQPLPPFRSIHKSLTLDKVLVQFVDPRQLTPYSYAAAHELLQSSALIQDSDFPAGKNLNQELSLLEDRVDELLQDDPVLRCNSKDGSVDIADSCCFASSPVAVNKLDKVKKDAFRLTSPLDIKWLMRYRNALDESTIAMPHDLMQCPPLVLLVCTTDEISTPVECLQELANSVQYLPEPFHNGLYDPKAMRQEVLVLHDNITGPKDWDETALRLSLQRHFGSNASLVRINSVFPDAAVALAVQENDDLWGGQGRLGNCLSVNDRVVLQRYFQTLITGCLFPALERRISELNAIVSERKKGVRNLVKSFWRKPKDGNAAMTVPSVDDFNDSSASSVPRARRATMVVRYRSDSIESQTRLLADMLFLIQDYDAALGIYRLIRDDYKSDKAMVYYANVQEMMALCMIHTDPYGRAKEIFSQLESSLFSYTRAAEEERIQLAKAKNDPAIAAARPDAAPHATRLGTRLCLLIASSPSITSGRELEVADLLASASSHESSLGAAVLLEQASSFYHRAEMYRKYAFHMLMSGHMFRSAHQEHHAFRCFTSALYIYRHGNWDELHNHLRSALAAQLYTMGRMSVSLLLYAKLVGTVSGGKVSVKSQQKFINHLIDICRDNPKKALAGANRMVAAVPMGMDSAHLEAIRKANLDRIVQVIRFTKNASRVLELPQMNMPSIDDNTIHVWSPSSLSRSFPGLPLLDSDNATRGMNVFKKGGQAGVHGAILSGEDLMWEQLQLLVIAELNARDHHNQSNLKLNTSQQLHPSKPFFNLEESVSVALAKITDMPIRRVLIQLDKEQANRNMFGRAKRLGNVKLVPATRSRKEPIFCSFVVKNLLAVDVEVTELQLVAQMTREDGDGSYRICTNQDAIMIGPGPDVNSREDVPLPRRQWSFLSAQSMVFFAPDFGRMSEILAGDNQCECDDRLVWKSVAGITPDEETPYFVVTKSNLALSANSEVVVSAGITPLELGDLELIGVRCRLFDKVWVYHPFKLKYPYSGGATADQSILDPSDSIRLKARVEADMPCLTAELVARVPNSRTSQVEHPAQGHLFDGQISLWQIRLSNVGSAPATNVVLKTNLPWVCIPDWSVPYRGGVNSERLSLEQLEAFPVSNCIGPTGTLMTLPLYGESLEDEGVIHPGETVDIPIDLRTTGSGVQSFYMLYRFELSGQVLNNRPHRWLQKLYEVTVIPSLSMSAKILPSWKENEHMLSVEVTNNRTDRRIDGEGLISLENLHLTSRAYRLELVPFQFKGLPNVIANCGSLRLAPEERVTVHYTLHPLEFENTACLVSGCSFGASDETVTSSTDCHLSSLLSFVCLEQAHERFKTTWKAHEIDILSSGSRSYGESVHPRSIAQIRRANTNDLSRENSSVVDSSLYDEKIVCHPTSLARLCPPPSSATEITILCTWNLSTGPLDSGIQGIHHLRGISVLPENNYKRFPISASADYPESIVHDFRKGPLMFPLALKLKNERADATADFSIAMKTSATFELIGIGTNQMSLGPCEERCLPLQTLIPKPGVYDLQALEVKMLAHLARALAHRERTVIWEGEVSSLVTRDHFWRRLEATLD